MNSKSFSLFPFILTFILVLSVPHSLKSQVEIYALRGLDNFIEGMPGIINKIYAENVPVDTWKVRFSLTNASNQLLKHSDTAVFDMYDESEGGGWRINLPMHRATPGCKLRIQCIDVSDNVLSTAYGEFNIIPRPDWLDFQNFNARVYNVRTLGTKLKMNVEIPVGGDDNKVGGYYFSDTINGTSIVHKWDKVGSTPAKIIAATSDKRGNLYIGGSFTGNWNPGSGALSTPAGKYSGYLVKYDKDRRCEWAIRIGNFSEYDFLQECQQIEIDNNGNLYVSGAAYAGQSQSFNNVTARDSGMYVAKFDPTGRCLWARFRYQEYSVFEFRTNIALDKQGNCYLVSQNESKLTTGGKTYDVYKDGYNYIMKYTPYGNQSWIKFYKPQPDEDDDVYSQFTINDIDANRDGQLFITGEFRGTMKLGDFTLNNKSSDIYEEDIFYAMLNTHGESQWVKTVGGLYVDKGARIMIDSYDEHFYLFGSVQGNVSFPGNQTINGPTTEYSDYFLGRFKLNGNCEWIKTITNDIYDFSEMGSWDTRYNSHNINEDGEGNIIYAGGKDRSLRVVQMDTLGNENWTTNAYVEIAAYNIQSYTDLLGTVHVAGTHTYDVAFGDTAMSTSGYKGFYASIVEDEVENEIVRRTESTNIIPPDVDPSFSNFKGMKFDFKNIKVSFDLEWDLATGKALIERPKVRMFSSVLSDLFSATTIRADELSDAIKMDDNFNLYIELYKKITPPSLKFQGPKITFPVTTWASCYFTFGARLGMGVSGRLIIGSQNNEFGFIEVGGKSTRVVGAILGDAWIRGGLEILYGAAEAYGTLTLSTQAGGGFAYISIPSSQISPLFGVNWQLKGSVTLAAGWGLAKHTFGPKTFASDNMGSLPELKSGQMVYDSYVGLVPVTVYKANATFELPEQNPEPLIESTNNHTVSAWIYREGEYGNLEFSYFDQAAGEFVDPIIIERNNHGISSPVLKLFDNGAVLLAWNQNQLSPEEAPASADLYDILDKEDLYIALYHEDELIGPYKIEESYDRIDGKPSLDVFGDRGLMLWQVFDKASNTNSIYFTTLSKNNADLDLGDPQQLPGQSGNNTKVKIKYINDQMAMALWINDPDNNSSTYNNKIMAAEWDGTQWSPVHEVCSAMPNQNYLEFDCDFNQKYGILAYTSQLTYGYKYLNYLNMMTYDVVSKTWVFEEVFATANPETKFNDPNVIVNDDHLAALSYYAQNIYATPNDMNQGHVNLFMRKLDESNGWTGIDQSKYLGDSTTFVWNLETAFSDQNNLYVITQEIDTLMDQNRRIHYGVHFAERELFLALRMVRLHENMTITDIAEPNTPLGIPNSLYTQAFKADLYPNPVTMDEAELTYHVSDHQQITVELFDVQGRYLYEITKREFSKGVYKTRINTANLKNGVYYIKLSTEKKTGMVKIIVIH